MNFRFADIIIPLAVKGRFTYKIPEILSQAISIGVSVLVQFGNRKIYSGIVVKLHNTAHSGKAIREIIRIVDPQAVVNETQLKFWRWLSEYYMCSEGEVMKAAMPSLFCLEGDKFLSVVEKYTPRKETFIELAAKFTDQELNRFLDKLAKAPKQSDVISTYLRLSEYSYGSEIKQIRKTSLLRESNTAPAVIDALVRKGLLSYITLETSRLKKSSRERNPLRELTRAQKIACDSVSGQFKEKDIVLLHGITSSGKTEIYIHLIEEQLKLGRQVLYLLPEIALTAQIIIRLQKHFGEVTGVYHSRFSDQEKVEIWKRVAENDPHKSFRLIIGVRSSIFLPFSKLGLVIVDEEHDGSYKQHDPAPRYHARDSAIMLASLHKAKSILGSASPSVESYNNAITGKYGFTEIIERYGSIRLPAIILANTREAYKRKLMVSHFTPELLEAIDEALENNEQVALFQNRRGFSPYIECSECGWIPACVQCAVNLTYHKGINRLVCHYCGYSVMPLSHCTSCNSSGLISRGFGTEKIEDEIKIIFPSARVARMDQDTTRKKNSFNRIIEAFEEGQIDILIGTQMISKGLDFENLTVVGILNADNLLNYPDFRAHERSFQLMEQVSGRAGRRKKEGKVVIQTSDPSNRIIRLLLQHDYKTMFRTQAEERRTFFYPPFCRMIKIIIRHKERTRLNKFAAILGDDLKAIFGKGVLGPEFPLISQVQKWYIKTIILKIERERPLAKAKQMILHTIERLEKENGASALKIAIDVDPY